MVVSDQEAVMEPQIGAFAMVVVSDLAIAAGAASIPGPVTDADDDGWFVWEGICQMAAGSIGGNTINGQTQWYEFDSKAMRRIEQGFGLAVMVENSQAAIGAFDIWATFSILTSRD